jgi:adenylate kinase
MSQGERGYRVILLGPPGAGKGTQAERLAAALSVPHVSTGDLFRYNIREGTALGREAQQYMDQGQLVPDAVTEAMVEDRLSRPDAARGAVMDGFPRNIAQAEAFRAILARQGTGVDRAVALTVPRDLLISRLTGRRLCPQCQATYHLEFNPPNTPGICDRCGASLVQRRDDARETVQRRLEVYDRETAPLIGFYREAGLLTEVDGTGTPDAVTARIREALGD